MEKSPVVSVGQQPECMNRHWNLSRGVLSTPLQGCSCSGSSSVNLDQAVARIIKFWQRAISETLERGHNLTHLRCVCVRACILLGSWDAFKLRSLPHCFSANLTAATSVPSNSRHQSPQDPLQTGCHFLPHCTCWIWLHQSRTLTNRYRTTYLPVSHISYKQV